MPGMMRVNGVIAKDNMASCGIEAKAGNKANQTAIWTRCLLWVVNVMQRLAGERTHCEPTVLKASSQKCRLNLSSGRWVVLATVGVVMVFFQGCAPLYYPMNPPPNNQANGYPNTFPNAYSQPYSQNYPPYPNSPQSNSQAYPSPYPPSSQQHGNAYPQVYSGNMMPANGNYQPAVVVVKSCECPPQGLGFVRIHSAPPFASVYVNGKSEGETPLEYITVPAGKANIELIHRQFGPADTVIEVRPGQKIDLKMHLAEFNGTGSGDE